MNRVVIFAHYDRDGLLDDYVYYYLMKLKDISKHLVFVTTADLSEESISRLNSLCYKVITRENTGYDFMSYKSGLEHVDCAKYDELVFCNDSVYGPFYSLIDLFDAMREKQCSCWSVTQSEEVVNHLQSYFLVFRKDVLSSSCFKEFWRSVSVLESKKQIIDQYEVGLSRMLIGMGYKARAYIEYEPNWLDYCREYVVKGASIFKFVNVGQAASILKILLKGGIGQCNVTHLFWKEIILNNNMPFVKIDLLRDNYLKLSNVPQYKSVIRQTGTHYPLELIEKHLVRMRSGK